MFNAYGYIAPDISLSPHGECEAKKLKGEFDYVVCSPLKRAKQTLLLSNIKYKTLIIDERIREHMNGNPINYFEGEEIKRESQENFLFRINSLKTELETRSDRVLVVGHHDIFLTWFGKSLSNGQMY